MAGLPVEVILQIFGGFFILVGFAGLFGIWKSWYWRSQRSIYGYIPFGLMFIVASIETRLRQQLGQAGWIVIAIYVVLFVVGSWGFIRPPRLIKPLWVRTIEEQSNAVYKAMSSEVKSGVDWRSRVASKEALEDWIRTIRRKLPKTPKKGREK